MQTVEDRIDNALDAALEMTFPASDPIAVYIAEAKADVKDLRRKTQETGRADSSENTSTFRAGVDPRRVLPCLLTSKYFAQ